MFVFTILLFFWSINFTFFLCLSFYFSFIYFRLESALLVELGFISLLWRNLSLMDGYSFLYLSWTNQYCFTLFIYFRHKLIGLLHLSLLNEFLLLLNILLSLQFPFKHLLIELIVWTGTSLRWFLIFFKLLFKFIILLLLFYSLFLFMLL